MKQLKELLKNNLTKKELELLPSSFDVVGDILIFSDFPKELEKKQQIIGNTILKLLKNVMVVTKKVTKYSGKFRTPRLRIIAGKRRKETIYKENNISLRLHVEKVYFSPRLSNERKRISQLVKPNENILIMFSGCAPYPCVIAKNTKAKEITGIEINPIAHKYAQENIQLNKLKNIKLILGDVKKIIPRIKKKFDRILMPLPKEAGSFLDLAFKISKKGTIIHFYDFLHEDELDKAYNKIADACKIAKKRYKILRIVKCGQFSPRIYRIGIDFQIT